MEYKTFMKKTLLNTGKIFLALLLFSVPLSFVSKSFNEFLFGVFSRDVSKEINHKDEEIYPGKKIFFVRKFLDGDTIEIDYFGEKRKIRFIGINTPEIAHNAEEKDECGGREASLFLKKILFEKKVKLAVDPFSSNEDKYGRLLRYVFTPEGKNANLQMLSSGWARAYTYFPFSLKSKFVTTEEEAQVKNLGIWKKCSRIEKSKKLRSNTFILRS